ncbi:putative disease resistance RPP13-like protein 1 [Miscanthus floridulus]|uniref:putative disease resistance RPP13-like protein 1 n=1 Tax=Miscanthus floridulus TaxID=154761 RepID=UPI003458F1E9
MAVVLDHLVPYVQQMVKDMAAEELRVLVCVTGGIKKLEASTEYFQDYATDAERRRIDDASMKRWVRKLKDALYEATDILELYQLHAEEEKRRRRRQLGAADCWTIIEEKAPGFLEPLLFCLRNPGFAHGLGVRLKQLNTSFDEIRREMVELGLKKQLMDSYPLVRRSQPGEASTPRSRKTTPSLSRSSTVVVGDRIEWDTRTLVQELLVDDDEPAAAKIKVVSIVGAGGMGKTTLAKNIFNHGDIQAGFAFKIWLSVTDSYDVEKLLSSADAQGLRPSRTGKLLLVMDDVWPKNHPWDAFNPIINNGAAARVIITTRDEGLLRSITTRDIATLQHHVNPLRDQDAWSLLKQQVMCSREVDSEDVDRLQHIGKAIVSKCDGSPLAIKVIAGLLRKNVQERYWKSVLDEPLWSRDRKKQHEVINSVLRLSYDDLSPPLKQCFLYFSLFPKGLVIQSNHIVGMWMSEGFLGNGGPGDRRTRTQIEEDGLDYYEDLVQVNLIEPAPEIAGDGSVCKMHDVIRSFAHEIAEEELLVVGPGQNSQLVSSSSAIRQLSVESTELESSSMALPEWSRISGKHRLLRSLIINGRVEFNAPTGAAAVAGEPTLASFPSLRALLVRHAETERFVESLCSLRHLRFLHLDSTDITRLPDGIGGLRFLQHIGLDNCSKFGGELPRSFLELERLTSLKVDCTECTVPKGFGVLTGLRRLSLFPAQTDGDWCSLQELGQLQELVRLEIRGLAAVPSAALAADARIHDKEQLVVLVLMCYNPPESISISEGMREECQRIEEVFDHLRPPRLLECLVLKDYMGRRLPSWMCVGGNIDLDSLTSLEMVSLPFCTQLPDGLCRLASLKRLYIKYASSIQRVGPEFQRNSGSRRSFPKLEFLRFDKLRQWEEWEWDEEEEQAQGNKDSIVAMPRLQQLGFFDCKLRRLPAGLASSNRRALRELVLWDLSCITSLENFPSVKELNVARCPRLRIIRGLANLRGVSIELCPALEVLQDVPALDTMHWTDPTVYELPDYLGGLKLNVLHLYCNPELTRALASGNYRTTLDKHPICSQIRVTPAELVDVVVSGGSSSTSTV